MFTRILTLSLICLASLQAGLAQTGQPKTESLTNKSIIDLHKAGLSDGIIISKIAVSDCRFDMSSNGLIDLKKQGISEDIIKAALNKSASAGNGNGSPNPAGTSPAASGSAAVPALELINQVYSYDKNHNNVRPLEKAVANIRTKMKAFGYGGTSVLYEIEGDQSPIKIAAKESPAFVVNTGNNTAPEITLYKLKTNKKTREATTMKAGTFSGMKSGENMISCNITSLGNGVYQLTPAKELEKGEYFFSGKAVTSGTNIDVFAFGVQ